MSVGVLLLTHEAMGHAMVETARRVLGELPLALAVREIHNDADPDRALDDAIDSARSLDQGDGVLVLADLYGATPCNIAHRLPGYGIRLHCVTGLNLPMLLRVMNYPGKSLDELADIAASGGRAGIVVNRG